MKFRIGLGFDLHRLGPGSHLILGGVEIPHSKSFIAHSDGDVLCHAVVDALLGAAGLGNIGERFPDTDPKYKGMSSLTFLAEAAEPSLSRTAFESKTSIPTSLPKDPNCCRTFLQCERRLLRPLGIPVEKISIKAKTMEGLGIIGTEEAIAAEAVALVFLRMMEGRSPDDLRRACRL